MKTKILEDKLKKLEENIKKIEDLLTQVPEKRKKSLTEFLNHIIELKCQVEKEILK